MVPRAVKSSALPHAYINSGCKLDASQAMCDISTVGAGCLQEGKDCHCGVGDMADGVQEPRRGLLCGSRVQHITSSQGGG
jgi:tetrahydrodipicolinate N-succinyltransferase